MKLFFKKLKYYYFRAINNTVKRADYYVKSVQFRKAAVFDDSVVVSAAASITNTQNDKSKISIGHNSIIHGHLLIFGFSGEIVIGENTFVGAGTSIWSAKKITIGSYVLLSHGVNIIDNISHPKNHRERMQDWDHIRSIGQRKENSFDIKEKEIVIGDNVWIGFNSSVHRGVTIGKGAIIGSNTVVTKDIPEFAIVAGNPAQVIGYTD